VLAVQVNTILEALGASPADVRSLVNGVLDDGSTPLNVAIAFRHFDVARTLVDRGSSVQLPDSFRLDGCRRKPIHYACSAGCLELVKTFVDEFDVDVDEPDDGNATPIHHAAAAGHIGTHIRPVAVVFAVAYHLPTRHRAISQHGAVTLDRYDGGIYKLKCSFSSIQVT